LSLLEIDGLDVHYGDFQALFGVSLKVQRGSVLALVGANGAGKTTLLRAVAGAFAPSGGSVRFDGLEITRLAPHRRIELGIAMVPEGRRLFGSLTVEENLLVGAAGGSGRGAAGSGGGEWPLSRIYETFPVIARRRRHRASQLSGGEQQAVAIGRALAASPSLLLLDEISLGLAPRIVGELYETLMALRAAGTTLVIVEQDLSRALSASDEVVCLLEGRVALSAPTPVDRDVVVAAYFGNPS
jgi:branched-chain amino acid transport system ATP-binding protein